MSSNIRIPIMVTKTIATEDGTAIRIIVVPVVSAYEYNDLNGYIDSPDECITILNDALIKYVADTVKKDVFVFFCPIHTYDYEQLHIEYPGYTSKQIINSLCKLRMKEFFSGGHQENPLVVCFSSIVFAEHTGKHEMNLTPDLQVYLHHLLLRRRKSEYHLSFANRSLVIYPIKGFVINSNSGYDSYCCTTKLVVDVNGWSGEELQILCDKISRIKRGPLDPLLKKCFIRLFNRKCIVMDGLVSDIDILPASEALSNLIGLREDMSVEEFRQMADDFNNI